MLTDESVSFITVPHLFPTDKKITLKMPNSLNAAEVTSSVTLNRRTGRKKGAVFCWFFK